MATTAGGVKIKLRTRAPAGPSAPAQAASTTTAASQSSSAPAPKLKGVIRRLPSNMFKTEFETLTADCINNDTCEWIDFIPGKVPEDRNKETTFARASFKVKTVEHLIAIRNLINGRPFTDSRGQEATALVEYAPYQKAPRYKGKTKVDARQGTIDDDPEFLAFLDNFAHTTGHGNKASNTVSEPTDTSTGPPDAEASKTYHDPLAIPVNAYDAPLNDGKATTTPLVEYIRQQKAAPKGKDKNRKAAEEEEAKSGSGRRRDRGGRRRDRDSKQSTATPTKGHVELAKPKERTGQSAKSSASETFGSKAAEKSTTQSATPVGPSANAQRPSRRERGNASFAAAILQRDLVGGAGRRDRRPKLAEASKASDAPATSTVESKIGDASRAGQSSTVPIANSSTTKAISSGPASAKTQSVPTGPSDTSRRNRRGGRNTDRGSVQHESIAPASTSNSPQTIMKPIERAKTGVEAMAGNPTDAPKDGSNTSAATGTLVPPTGPRNRGRGRNNSNKAQLQAQAGTPPSTTAPAPSAPSTGPAAPPTGPKAMQSQTQNQRQSPRGPAGMNVPAGPAGESGAARRPRNRGGRRGQGGGGGGGAANGSAAPTSTVPTTTPSTPAAGGDT